MADIARIRGFKNSTIYGHLDEALMAGEAIDVNELVPPAAQKEILAAFERHGFGNIGGVVETLGGKYEYGQCKIVRTAMQSKRA